MWMMAALLTATLAYSTAQDTLGVLVRLGTRSR
jgi:hypothetical protein